MYNIEPTKIANIFKFNAAEPLLFNSSFFLFLIATVLLIYAYVRKYDKLKIIFLILFSYYFYYKSSGIYLFLLLFISVSDFSIGYLISKATTKKRKMIFLLLSLCIDLGILFYFKYTNFFTEIIYNITQKPFNPFNIILPVGISFFTFQSISYVIDIYREKIKPLTSLLDYVFYVSFFPQLVAGPIVRAKDFIPQIHNTTKLTKETWHEAFMLIIIGLFKKCIISDYISVNFVDRIFDAPTLYSGIENLFAVYGYAVQIYCDFSGYSDIAIGLALLFGYRFNINFDSPYRSASISEFWKRWHISLSTWLKDYLYISLGGNRKGKKRMYANLMITMTLGGLWHGASLNFILWGILHGMSLSVHKFLLNIFPAIKKTGDEMKSGAYILGTFITFHIVCLGWIFFRAENIIKVKEVLTQILFHFNPHITIEFIKGYYIILILITGTLIMQFLPKKLEFSLKQKTIDSPWSVKILYLTGLIVLIAQIRSSEIQPFIYFQF